MDDLKKREEWEDEASPFHIIHDVPSLTENNDKTNKAITWKKKKKKYQILGMGDRILT